MMPVAVVGGGIVGLCCAYFLLRRGVAVTVFEAGRFGGAASRGNAGLVSPSLSAPIPGPGALVHALASLRHRDATITLRPTASPVRLLWLARFARHCTGRRQLRGLHATALLSERALAAYDELVEDGVPFTMREAPLVFAFAAERAAERGIAELAPMEAYGYPPPELTDGQALRRIEPALGEHVRAGFVVPGERFVDPATVAAGLVERLRSLGADLRDDCPVTTMAVEGRSRWIEAGGQRDAFKTIVIAAGADSRRVARLAGVRLPIEGGKGHSVSVALRPLPRGPVGLMEPKVACTPLGERLRLTGGMELGGRRGGVDAKVIEGILRAAGRYFDALDIGSARDAWSGMRPMAPNGLPVIGPAPGRRGVYLATGHSTLGVTLGPITGRLVADHIVDGRADAVLAPFAP